MLGVFGGTFDPVHYGHLKTAWHVHQALQLTSTLMIPLGIAVHRQQPKASADQRFQMLSAAVNEFSGLVADSREIDRPGDSYTVDTLKTIRQDFKKEPVCLIIGTDAFNQFHRWHQPQTILELAHLVVMHRPGISVSITPENQFLQQHLCESANALHQKTSGYIHSLQVPQLDISSTLIRQRIQHGSPVSDLLPQAVEQLIRQWALYQ